MPTDDHQNPEKEPQSQSTKRSEGGNPLRWVILAVVLIGGLWVGIQQLRKAEPAAPQSEGGGGQQGPPPATVIAAPVVQQPVQEKRRVTGTLRAVERAEVAAQESGAVKEVRVDVGDKVEKGDVLMLLDDRRLRATLAEAESRNTAATAVVEERKAEEKRATTDLEMKEKLLSQRAVAEREFLDAEREASVASARRKAAEDERKASESALELLRVRVADLEVKAPFSGRVVQRNVDPGEWIAPGDSVVTLVSSGTIEAWMNVPERFMGSVTEGESPISIIADGTEASSPAKSIRRVSDIDPVTRLFPVVVEIDDLEGELAPGMSVHAEIPVSEMAGMLAVPVDAVLETFQGASVFRVSPTEDGGMPIAERVPVNVRFRRDGLTFLDAESLKPGQMVVVEGNERLFPGTPLIVGELEEGEEAPVEGVKP